MNKKEFPGYIMHMINHAFLQKKNDMLAQYGITSSQNKVMLCLWENDGLSQSEILKQIDIKASSLTKLIEPLEKKNLIKRQECFTDCRIKKVYLTDLGKDLEKKSMEVIYKLEDELIKDFSPEEKKELLNYLNKMLNSIMESR